MPWWCPTGIPRAGRWQGSHGSGLWALPGASASDVPFAFLSLQHFPLPGVFRRWHQWCKSLVAAQGLLGAQSGRVPCPAALGTEGDAVAAWCCDVSWLWRIASAGGLSCHLLCFAGHSNSSFPAFFFPSACSGDAKVKPQVCLFIHPGSGKAYTELQQEFYLVEGFPKEAANENQGGKVDLL